MITIKIGGFPFKLPQRWSEVTPEQARRLTETDNTDLLERLFILGKVPKLIYPPDLLLAAYEIISFVEEMPITTTNKVEVRDIKKWTFTEFEQCRKVVAKHAKEPVLAFITICEYLGYKDKDYIEVGAKACDMMFQFMERWAEWGIFDERPLTDKEVHAGIERLQGFGVYAILESIAEKYSKLPKDIEQEPCEWVYLEWTYINEKVQYQNNLSE